MAMVAFTIDTALYATNAIAKPNNAARGSHSSLISQLYASVMWWNAFPIRQRPKYSSATWSAAAAAAGKVREQHDLAVAIARGG